jgi:hypothetical protein
MSPLARKYTAESTPKPSRTRSSAELSHISTRLLPMARPLGWSG